jgi:hypothetical protein
VAAYRIGWLSYEKGVQPVFWETAGYITKSLTQGSPHSSKEGKEKTGDTEILDVQWLPSASMASRPWFTSVCWQGFVIN